MNRFVQMYKNKIAEGKDIDHAIVSVASDIAYLGSIEDLQKVEEAHSKDFIESVDLAIEDLRKAIKYTGGTKNENNQINLINA